MWRIIFLSTIQSLLFAGGQVFLKAAMNATPKFDFTRAYVWNLLTSLPMILSGICMAGGTVLWMYIIKHFDFSIVYPVTSISYIFGMLAAIYVFQETVPATRWIGVVLIMGGVVLTAK